jgi:hypothetical protein
MLLLCMTWHQQGCPRFEQGYTKVLEPDVPWVGMRMSHKLLNKQYILAQFYLNMNGSHAPWSLDLHVDGKCTLYNYLQVFWFTWLIKLTISMACSVVYGTSSFQVFWISSFQIFETSSFQLMEHLVVIMDKTCINKNRWISLL